MHPASSEAARRQIVEFDELVSRFDRINDSSSKPACTTSSLDSGLTSYGDAGNLGGAVVGSTLSLDRPPNPQADTSFLDSLARWSRSSAFLNYLGGGQRSSPLPTPAPLVEQVQDMDVDFFFSAFDGYFFREVEFLNAWSDYLYFGMKFFNWGSN